MGAFLITYPRDRIRMVLLFGWFAQVTFVPAILLVGLWFLTQVFSEVGALVEMQKGGVAYMATLAGLYSGWPWRGFSRAADGVSSKGWSRDVAPG